MVVQELSASEVDGIGIRGHRFDAHGVGEAAQRGYQGAITVVGGAAIAVRNEDYAQAEISSIGEGVQCRFVECGWEGQPGVRIGIDLVVVEAFVSQESQLIGVRIEIGVNEGIFLDFSGHVRRGIVEHIRGAGRRHGFVLDAEGVAERL